ncbi:hypothetical protein ACTMTI_45680 [Nonomuraea sp. H19]|uniref:hypothetical protein n=1 Tax=Nonomuraea sp. H19 TaxID=3452206 RepID=UPI003F8C6011
MLTAAFVARAVLVDPNTVNRELSVFKAAVHLVAAQAPAEDRERYYDNALQLFSRTDGLRVAPNYDELRRDGAVAAAVGGVAERRGVGLLQGDLGIHGACGPHPAPPPRHATPNTSPASIAVPWPARRPARRPATSPARPCLSTAGVRRMTRLPRGQVA